MVGAAPPGCLLCGEEEAEAAGEWKLVSGPACVGQRRGKGVTRGQGSRRRQSAAAAGVSPSRARWAAGAGGVASARRSASRPHCEAEGGGGRIRRSARSPRQAAACQAHKRPPPLSPAPLRLPRGEGRAETLPPPWAGGRRCPRSLPPYLLLLCFFPKLLLEAGPGAGRERGAMPLLHRKPFVRAKPPADLRPDERVFYCRVTNEIFRDYE